MAYAPATVLLADHELVGAVRDGDIEAFTFLVDRHHGPLLRYLACQTGDPELAADLTQEAFLDAFRRLDHLDRESSFSAWLYGIAKNQLRMEWRRRRLRRFVSLDWVLAPITTVIPGHHQADDHEHCHERDAIQQALDELTPALREALLLHDLAGYTAPQVAQILGISLSAAQRRISRAKLQFRDRYGAVNQDGL